MRKLKCGILCDFPKVIKVINTTAEMYSRVCHTGKLAFEGRL